MCDKSCDNCKYHEDLVLRQKDLIYCIPNNTIKYKTELCEKWELVSGKTNIWDAEFLSINYATWVVRGAIKYIELDDYVFVFDNYHTDMVFIFKKYARYGEVLIDKWSDLSNEQLASLATNVMNKLIVYGDVLSKDTFDKILKEANIELRGYAQHHENNKN